MFKANKIPSQFWQFLWSVKPSVLDLEQHKNYIVHSLLHYGDIDAYLWLKENYSLETLREIFISKPYKIYTKKSFHFVSTYLLKIETSPEAQKYVVS